MAEPITTPRKLLAAGLRRMLWVELTLAGEELPRLLEAAHAAALRLALERHLLETREHVDTLRRVLGDLQVHAEPEESAALAGIVKEHVRLASRTGDGDGEGGGTLLDLVHVQAAAAAQHVQLAAYEGLASLAAALGEEEVAAVLRRFAGEEAFGLEQVERARTKLLAEHVETADAHARP